MSMIDTYGPSRMYLAGRGQALSELASRQQNERAGVDDQRQMMALQQAQARMDAEAQAVARKRAEDDQVSQMLRARILELIPPPEVSMPAGGEKAGPFQPGMEPQATVTDRFGDIRKAAETGGLPVLQALSKLVPDRLRLSQIQNQIDTLIARKDYLDDSPEKTLVDHISGAVRGGNLQDAEAGMRLLIQQQARQQAEAGKVKAGEAQIQQLAADLSAQFKIPMEEALRRVRLTKGNVINEGQNQTAGTRSGPIAALAREINAPVDGLALVMGEERVDPEGQEWVTVEKGGNRFEIKKAMWPIIQKFGSWEAAIQALRQANGMPGELAPSPSIGGAPGVPTQASSPMAQPAAPGPSIDIQVQVIQQLTKQLGREPTDEEIDAAMGGL